MATIVAFEVLDEHDLDSAIERQKARDAGGRRIRCARCGHAVCAAEQRIDRAGAHEHRFENPAGFSYRIGCFRHAPGCRCVGDATLEWTWFPGHAWSVALCRRCGAHLGWGYGPGATGGAFFGLILDRLAEEM